MSIKWIAASLLGALLAGLLTYTAWLGKHHPVIPPPAKDIPIVTPPTPQLSPVAAVVPPVAHRTFTNSAECAECHKDIYAEWQNDQHSTAWTEDKYRVFTENYNRVECLSCHAPEPMLQVGITQEPKLRTTFRDEGVDCLSCHVKDGRTYGTLGTNAVCGGTLEKALKTSDACYHCHSAHNLFKEYLASEHYKRGVTCQDCHMERVDRPVVTGGITRSTRRHTFHGGGHDLAAIKEALNLKLVIENGVAVVTVSNVGAAHGIPGEINNRVIRLEVFCLANNATTGVEEELDAFREQFRPPPRFLRDKVPSTQIMPGEPRVLRYALPAPHGKVQAQLMFKLEYTEPDTTAVELIKTELEY